MRCRLISLISDHPIQQGSRKGGGPDFLSQRSEDRQTDRRGMAYSCSWMTSINFTWGGGGADRAVSHFDKLVQTKGTTSSKLSDKNL